VEFKMQNSLEHFERGEDQDSWAPKGRQELVEYLHAVRRGWRIIVPVCLLTVGAAWYSMSGRPLVYTASVLLQVTEAAPMAAVSGPQLRSEPLDYASQVEIIRSRSVLSGPVDSLGFQLSLGERSGDRSKILLGFEMDRTSGVGRYLLASTDAGGAALLEPATGREAARAPAGSWLDLPGFRLLVDGGEIGPEPIPISVISFENAIERLKGRLVVEPGLGPALIRIRYSDPDPVYSAAVANHVARAYEEFRASAAREAAGVRKEFLANRLAEITDSLQRVQQNLLDYQQSQGSLDPRLEGNSLMTALLQAENEVRLLRYQEGLLEDLVGTLSAEPSSDIGMHRLVALGGSVLPGGGDLYTRLQQLNAERNSLTASRFGQTERGPQVEVIDSLRAATWRDVRALANDALALRRNEIQTAMAHVDALRGSVGAVPERSAEFTRLGQQVDAVQNIFDRLLGGYYEAQIAEAVETGDIRIVDPATVPLGPAPVNFMFNMSIAALVGLIFGAGGVVLRHHFDNRVKRAEEAERSANLQTMGMIPHLNGNGKTALNGPGVEAFRGLATSLTFVDAHRPMVVAVASAAPGEGKTTVAVNLAISSAASGRRVLLIDSDFRRPVVHSLLKEQRSPGLSDVLQGNVPAIAAMRRVEGWGMDVMTCGSPVEDPTSVLARGGLPELLERLRQDYDLIIVDTAPVLAVAESVIVCTAADGVLFAVRANRTDQRAVFEATTKIRRMKGSLMGLVLTDVPTGGSYSRESYGYYDYGYQASDHEALTNSAKSASRVLERNRRS
jgi:polysaccharide biosynthesis transport protein